MNIKRSDVRDFLLAPIAVYAVVLVAWIFLSLALWASSGILAHFWWFFFIVLAVATLIAGAVSESWVVALMAMGISVVCEFLFELFLHYGDQFGRWLQGWLAAGVFTSHGALVLLIIGVVLYFLTPDDPKPADQPSSQ